MGAIFEAGNNVRRTRSEAAPALQKLVESKILAQEHSVLCYGCGSGADVNWLRMRKFSAAGYDPHPPYGYSDLPSTRFDFVLLVYLMARLKCDEARRATLAKAFQFVRPGGCLVIASRNWRRLCTEAGLSVQDCGREYFRSLLEGCDRFDLRVPAFETGDQSACLLVQRSGIYEARLPFTWIDTPEGLEAACAELARAGIVGLDVETTLDEPRRLCTVQLATERETFIIDALAFQDLAPLKRLMECASVIKVIHNAMFEEQMMATRGIKISSVFDTLPASRKKHKRVEGGHKLGEVCERELQYFLDKRLQMSDWTTRPLSAAQLSYAAIDAEVLLPLYRIFTPPAPPENLSLF